MEKSNILKIKYFLVSLCPMWKWSMLSLQSWSWHKDREWTWTLSSCSFGHTALRKVVASISSEWQKTSPRFLHQLTSWFENENTAKTWICHNPLSETGCPWAFTPKGAVLAWRALTAVAAFSAYVKCACRAFAFLQNFHQVSCLQGQKQQMRQDNPEKATEEVK